jgi:thioredoxin-related protein
VTGREPEKKNPYYSSKVTWLLVVLVGVALLVVGLTIVSDQRETETGVTKQSIDSTESITDTITVVDEPGKMEAVLTDSIPWRQFNQALSEIEGESRFAMLFFRSENCGPCDHMESEVFTKDQILDAFEHKILPVRIESNSNEKIQYRGRILSESGLPDIFNISGYPTLVFYDGQTQRYLFTLPGFIDIENLHRIFEFLRSRMFETDSVTLQEYISG